MSDYKIGDKFTLSMGKGKVMRIKTKTGPRRWRTQAVSKSKRFTVVGVTHSSDPIPTWWRP